MNNKNVSQKNKNKRKLSKAKIICICIVGVLLLAMIVVGIVILQAINQPDSLFNTAKINDNLQSQDSLLPDLKEQNEDADKSDVTPEKEETDTVLPLNDSGIINVLLLGIDSDLKIGGNGDPHTDAIIVLAINFKKNMVDMISLPRDTFTHVPGINGIYKLNAALNCGGGKTEAGFNKVCEASEWMLGGISIDYYCAFDLDTVIEIGDMIGGVDFEVDMSYTGESGNKYKKGMQHLDGTGIYDYMRTRKAATVNATDKGRMNRCKAMLIAMFSKIKNSGDLAQVPSLLGTVDEGMYTNMNLQQLLALANFGLNINENNIGSYTMTGDIRSAADWNFMFIDQDYRIELIKQIYGVTVPEQELVSYEYAKWLKSYGFKTVKYIYNADNLINYINDLEESSMTQEQTDAYAKLIKIRKTTYTAFVTAEYSLSNDDTKQLQTIQTELKDQVIASAKLFDFSNQFSWKVSSDWTHDSAINSVTVDFR